MVAFNFRQAAYLGMANNSSFTDRAYLGLLKIGVVAPPEEEQPPRRSSGSTYSYYYHTPIKKDNRKRQRLEDELFASGIL
jgi:hypothetical protein